MTYDIEPLDPALWFERVELIAKGELRPVENALRHAFHLLQLAPREVRHVARVAIPEDKFESLLDGGNFDSAARHLVAQPTVLTVKNGVDGSAVRAAISCSVLGRTIEGSGDTVAVAVLNAWMKCLLSLRGEFEPRLSRPLRRPTRTP